MIYGVTFAVCGTLGDVYDVTKEFEAKGITLKLPSQPVDAFTPILVKCVAPDKETYEWMVERLHENENVSEPYPFFYELDIKEGCE